MPTEIERKFLIKHLPEGWQKSKSEHIAQGYLFNGSEGVVRVRKKGNSYYQTIKSIGKMVREEIEIELSQAQFELLWKYIKGNKISKTRYYLPYKSFLVELDIFDESLNGLIVAEVEFENEMVCNSFQAPEWFGKEVTDDPRYQNNQLSIHGIPT